MNKVCRIIKNIFIRLDIFGVPMEITLFNRERYRTCYGTLLAIVLVSFLAVKTITLLVEMATRREFSTKLIEYPDINTHLQLNNFTLYLCPSDQVNLAKWSYGNFSNFNMASSDVVAPYNCPLSKLDEQYKNAFNNCICYDLESHKLTDSNTLSNLTTSIGSFSLLEQNLNEKDRASSLSGSNDMCLFYSKSYVITQNYYKPIQSRQQMHFLQNLSGKFISIDFHAENNEVFKENDYSFGIENNEKYDGNITTISSVRIQQSKLESTGGLVTIQFSHSGWKKKYVFNGFDADKFFSTLGGYYEIWIWLFTIIGNFINNKLLKKDIRKRLNTQKEKTVMIELDNIKKREMVEFDSDNVKLDQQPGDLITNFIDNEMDNASSIKHTSSQSIHHGILDPNKFTFQINPPKKKGEQLLKRETINQNFNPVEQFESTLDLANIYNIIKEIKILEVLCLNQKTAHVFCNSKNCEIDIEKLDRYIKDCVNTVEPQYILDSFENKIDLIHQAIIDHSKLSNESTFKKITNYIARLFKKKDQHDEEQAQKSQFEQDPQLNHEPKQD